VYGARPLKRVIQHHIEDELAQRILSGDVVDGDTVNVGVEDGKVVFT
jgi:ATP-dependent Clp protease ATP-binding subunit ClpA